MKALDYTKLHCQNNNSNKFYEVQVVEITPDLYGVIARYGRIESFPGGNEAVKKITRSRQQAATALHNLVRQKLGKGYVIVTEDEQEAPLFVEGLLLNEDVRKAKAEHDRALSAAAEARVAALRGMRPFENHTPLFG